MTDLDCILMLGEIDCSDNESAHSMADDIILTWLTENGHHDIVSAYRGIEQRCDGGFWYA